MTKSIKQIIRNYKKKLEQLLIRLENDEDVRDLQDIISYIEKKLS